MLGALSAQSSNQTNLPQTAVSALAQQASISASKNLIDQESAS